MAIGKPLLSLSPLSPLSLPSLSPLSPLSLPSLRSPSFLSFSLSLCLSLSLSLRKAVRVIFHALPLSCLSFHRNAHTNLTHVCAGAGIGGAVILLLVMVLLLRTRRRARVSVVTSSVVCRASCFCAPVAAAHAAKSAGEWFNVLLWVFIMVQAVLSLLRTRRKAQVRHKKHVGCVVTFSFVCHHSVTCAPAARRNQSAVLTFQFVFPFFFFLLVLVLASSPVIRIALSSLGLCVRVTEKSCGRCAGAEHDCDGAQSS
jgi:hypothetical protein